MCARKQSARVTGAKSFLTAALALCWMLCGLIVPEACRANQVTNPYLSGTATAATNWTSSAAGTGAAFNHALSAANASITAAGGSTEFYSGCVGATCLTYPFASGTTSGAQQTVSTTVGQQYTISFWTYFSTAGNSTVEIDVYWGATKIYAGTSVAAAGWSQHTINLGAAAAASNVLTVMIRDDPSYSAVTGLDIEPVGPNVVVSKSSSLISDPVNSTTNPKIIPGALVEYCFLVSNTGVAAASAVTATDPLPATLTFVAGTITSGTTCANSVTSGGATMSGSTLTANIGPLAAGASYAVKFRATVN